MTKLRCPLCGEHDVVTLLRRSPAAVFQNVLYASAAEARAAGAGRIDLAACRNCGFVFNAAYDAALVNYSGTYENDQSHSEVFAAQMRELADRLLGAVPENGTVVDVGCGQGTFLRCLAERAPSKQLSLRGIDPSYRGEDLPRGIVITGSTLECAAGGMERSADVVVARYVLEQVRDPVEFLIKMRALMQPTSRARLFLETPRFEWIMANEAVHDVYYERVNYFTADMLHFALDRAGFEVLSSEGVAGDEYLWICAAPLTERSVAVPAPVPARAGIAIAEARVFADRTTSAVRRWRQLVADDVPTAIWGAGGKGVTFAALIDRDQARIECLVDINPNKQRQFVPLTAHPVVSPEQAFQRGVRRVLVMNPFYREEIRSLIAGLNRDVALVNVLQTNEPAPA